MIPNRSRKRPTNGPAPTNRCLACLTALLAIGLTTSLHGTPTAYWIWHEAPEPESEVTRYFRHTFELNASIVKATLTGTADNEVTFYINGEEVAEQDTWQRPVQVDVTDRLRQGENVLAARARNHGGAAGLIAKLETTLPNERERIVVTDDTWMSSKLEDEGWLNVGYDATNWMPVATLGAHGVEPWGEVLNPPQATPADSLEALPGFQVELLRSAQFDEGSWVSLTIDDQGRLIVSPQAGDQPLLRMTLSDDGRVADVSPIPAPVGGAMGLLHAHDSLYVNGQGPEGSGLYRLIDQDGDDRFEEGEERLLQGFDSGGEHGYHGVTLGPDGMLYVINGNHTGLPEGIANDSQHQHYAEDLLHERQWDAGGHAVGIKAPGGYILRTDPEGHDWELMLGGFRNAYDLDFNPEGEMFTFDSDMEWDWGLPWYRPTRVLHCVSGGEYGWRSGTGKWPTYYPDSLPPVVNIGIGSPTGVKFGTESHFPPRYKNALFILDWTYGRIIAAHLEPDGATYSGSYEPFVRGEPLNLTDIEFGPEGAMYFTVGGRGTQAGLYRVTYNGENGDESSTSRQASTEPDAVQARHLRRNLEAFHGKTDAGAIDFAWPYLNSRDRWIRYAARIAVESQDPSLWTERALEETRLRAGLTALVALARRGSSTHQEELLASLERLADRHDLNEQQTLAALRVVALAFVRMGEPSSALRQDVIDRFNPLYPADSRRINRELCKILVYLRAPNVIEKTLSLLEQTSLQQQQIHYVFNLLSIESGWTTEQRRRYLSWFNQDLSRLDQPPELLRWFEEVGRGYSNGASFQKYLDRFWQQAIEGLSEDKRLALKPIIDAHEAEDEEAPAVTQRELAKNWTMEDFVGELDAVDQGRSYEQGKRAYAVAQCLACHMMNGQGGAVGPDLTAISNRFSRRDILKSILEPSEVVSEQYQNVTLTLKDGGSVIGRIVNETEEHLVVEMSALANATQKVAKDAIESRETATGSPMPAGLVNILSKEEILDLLAYLESGGDPDAHYFSGQASQ